MPQGTVVSQPTADSPAARVPAPSAPSPQEASRPRSALRARAGRAGWHLFVVACFALPAVVLWWHAWDGHLSSTLTCACGDTGQTVWFVAWPAYAIAHGLDPFISAAVQAPAGVNMLSNASSLPVGVVLAPITWSLGPVAATNVALTVCPALSAWACWVACRRFVAWRVAPVVAGALFGYSPFVVTNLALGHIGLCLLVCPPLLVVCGYEVLFGAPHRRRRFGLALGALLALQFFISSEVLAIVAVVGVPAGALAALVGARAGRLAPLPELVRALGAALGLALVLLAFPVWFFLAGPQHLRGPLWSAASIEDDPLYALWSAGHYRASATTLTRLGGYLGQVGPPSSYLGPAVLGAAGLSLVVAWRRRSAWLFAFAGVVAAWCSLGILVWLSPRHADDVWLPWRVLGSWPLLDDVIPQRFSAVVDLCVALLIGVGLDRARSLGAATWARRAQTREPSAQRRRLAGRLAAVCLAVGGLVVAASPWRTFQVPFATSAVVVPRWFSTQAREVPAGTVVLSVPFPFPIDGASGPMVWQAVDDMAFRLAGAYAKVPGKTGRSISAGSVPLADEVLASLSTRAPGRLPRGTAAQIAALRRALFTWHVDDVVITPGAAHVQRAVTILRAAIGRPPRRQAGAWVWTSRSGLERTGGAAP